MASCTGGCTGQCLGCTSCSGGCTGGCGTNCTGQCYSCGSGCSNSCTGTCWGCMGCDNTCSGSGSSCSDCTGSCSGTATGETCTDCTTTCASNCTIGCTATCASNCVGCTATCANDCVGTCKAACANDCITGCNTSCLNECYSGCKTACSGCSGTCSSCQAWCVTGCQSTCAGGCGDTCAGGCGDQCRGGCSGACMGCSTTCMDGCSTECNGCVGTCIATCAVNCNTECSVSCGACGAGCTTNCGGCTGSCDQTCKDTCAGECKLECYHGCHSSCKETCSNTCMGTCKNGCFSCSTSCSTNCSVTCNTNCYGACNTLCTISCSSPLYNVENNLPVISLISSVMNNNEYVTGLNYQDFKQFLIYVSYFKDGNYYLSTSKINIGILKLLMMNDNIKRLFTHWFYNQNDVLPIKYELVEPTSIIPHYNEGQLTNMIIFGINPESNSYNDYSKFDTLFVGKPINGEECNLVTDYTPYKQISFIINRIEDGVESSSVFELDVDLIKLMNDVDSIERYYSYYFTNNNSLIPINFEVKSNNSIISHFEFGEVDNMTVVAERRANLLHNTDWSNASLMWYYPPTHWKLDTSVKFNGQNTMKYSMSGQTSDSTVNALTSLEMINVKQGETYTFSAWIKTDEYSKIDGLNPRIYLRYGNVDWGYVTATTYDIQLTENDVWTKVSVSGVVPNDPRISNVRAMFIVYRNGTVWVAQPEMYGPNRRSLNLLCNSDWRTNLRAWSYISTYWSLDTDVKFNGQNTIKYNVSGKNVDLTDGTIWTNSNYRFKVISGEKYTFSVWLKTDNYARIDGRSIHIGLRYADINQIFLNEQVTYIKLTKNNIWEKFVISGVVPDIAGIDNMRVKIAIFRNGTIWAGQPELYGPENSSNNLIPNNGWIKNNDCWLDEVWSKGWVRDTAVKFNDYNTMNINRSGLTADLARILWLNYDYRIKVSPGEKYLFTVWIKTDDYSKIDSPVPAIRLRYGKSDNSVTSGGSSLIITLTENNTWTKFSVYGTVPDIDGIDNLSPDVAVYRNGNLWVAQPECKRVLDEFTALYDGTAESGSVCSLDLNPMQFREILICTTCYYNDKYYTTTLNINTIGLSEFNRISEYNSQFLSSWMDINGDIVPVNYEFISPSTIIPHFEHGVISNIKILGIV